MEHPGAGSDRLDGRERRRRGWRRPAGHSSRRRRQRVLAEPPVRPRPVGPRGIRHRRVVRRLRVRAFPHHSARDWRECRIGARRRRPACRRRTGADGRGRRVERGGDEVHDRRHADPVASPDTGLDQAQAVYGKNSTQAAQATAQLNYQMALLGNTAGVTAELGLAKASQALNTFWDLSTSSARRVQAVNLMMQAIQLGYTMVPLVAQAAEAQPRDHQRVASSRCSRGWRGRRASRSGTTSRTTSRTTSPTRPRVHASRRACPSGRRSRRVRPAGSSPRSTISPPG